MRGTFVGIYWAVRDESFEDRLRRLEGHFGALAATSDALARWYAKAWRKPREPKEIFVREPEVLRALLAKGVNRTDIDKTVITELGWSVHLWNADRCGLSASTSIGCGKTSPFVRNVALVDCTEDGEGVLDDASAVELLKRWVEVWEPDTSPRGMPTLASV
jgi:hypothetical protein